MKGSLLASERQQRRRVPRSWSSRLVLSLLFIVLQSDELVAQLEMPPWDPWDGPYTFPGGCIGGDNRPPAARSRTPR